MGIIEADTMLGIGMLLAFGAGALSFLSPCVLPIFPAYLSYITGVSVKELQSERNRTIRQRILSHSMLFLLGVSLVYLSLGIGATFVGQWIQGMLTGSSGLLIQRLAGIFMVVMGLFVAGWLNIPTLMKEKRLQVNQKPIGYLGTLFVGVGFAAGWTPCIGPIFGSILFLAASHPSQGIVYTFMYVIGFIVPFLLFAFFLSSTKWIVRKSQLLMKIGGSVLVVMGLILFTGNLPVIADFFLRIVEDTWFENLG